MNETERNAAALAKDTNFATFIRAVFLYISPSLAEIQDATDMPAQTVVSCAKRARGLGYIFMIPGEMQTLPFTPLSRVCLTDEGNAFKDQLGV